VVPRTAALDARYHTLPFSFLVEDDHLFSSIVNSSLMTRDTYAIKVENVPENGWFKYVKKSNLILLVDVVKLKDVETLFSSAVGSCAITLRVHQT